MVLTTRFALPELRAFTETWWSRRPGVCQGDLILADRERLGPFSDRELELGGSTGKSDRNGFV